jgi:hypothetical protein
MRWRLIAWFSLGVNIIVVFAWMIVARRTAARYAGAMGGSAPDTGVATTNYMVRRQPFAWRQLESPDYAIYIANLRDIGCPRSNHPRHHHR